MLQLIPVPNIPIIQPQTDLGQLIADTLSRNGQALIADDIVVIAQKVVSKAEDRFVKLADVQPSEKALELATVTQKDAREIEVILWDTAEVIRARPGLLIVEHTLGFISANAGLDRSNVAAEDDIVLRLPADPDQSAHQIRDRLTHLKGQRSAVLIIDSHGRPWRLGTQGVTIGLAGIQPVQNLVGQLDLLGNPLVHTTVGLADQVAAAASLLMGQASEACPVILTRGLTYEVDETAQARDILRPKESDLFR